MVAIVRVTGSGQITIPAEFRHKHNIEKGDRVLVSENEAGQLVIRRTLTLEELAGSFKPLPGAEGQDFDEILAEALEEEADRIVAEMNHVYRAE